MSKLLSFSFRHGWLVWIHEHFSWCYSWGSKVWTASKTDSRELHIWTLCIFNFRTYSIWVQSARLLPPFVFFLLLLSFSIWLCYADINECLVTPVLTDLVHLCRCSQGLLDSVLNICRKALTKKTRPKSRGTSHWWIQWQRKVSIMK